jgi:hypothetical protein
MAIDFEETLSAPPARIQAVLLERGTWDRYAELAGALRHEFDTLESEEGVSTLFQRSMSSDPLITPLRRLVGPTVDIHEKVRWAADARSPSADVHVEIRKPQVAFIGRLVVEPITVDSRLGVEGSDPSVPLMVRPFMAQVRDVIETALRKLCQAVREELDAARA